MIGKLDSNGFVLLSFILSFVTIICLILQFGNGAATLNGVSQKTSQLTWGLFKDPENEFSMLYPTSWILEPAEDRFSDVDVEIVNGYDATNGLVQVLYYYSSEDISSMMKQYRVDQAELEKKSIFVFLNLYPDYQANLIGLIKQEVQSMRNIPSTGIKQDQSYFLLKCRDSLLRVGLQPL